VARPFGVGYNLFSLITIGLGAHGFTCKKRTIHGSSHDAMAAEVMILEGDEKPKGMSLA